MAGIPSYFPGLNGIRGYQDPTPEATPEEVHGSPANPAHGNWGEQAEPYSWQSQLIPYAGKTSPRGPENQLLGSTTDFDGMPAGQLGHDPYADLTPTTHAAPTNVTLSGALPSQFDAINQQLVQGAENRSTDLGGSRKYSLTELGDAQQDEWAGIWDVSDEPGKYPDGPAWSDTSQFGVGVNDRPGNPLRKRNGFGFDRGHHHRRFARGSIPGNYMWMRPGGRPMIKSLPGPARPAVGVDSPFTGDDLGASFGIQGAVLVSVPQEYAPPPGPQLVSPVNSDDPAPEIPIW